MYVPFRSLDRYVLNISVGTIVYIKNCHIQTLCLFNKDSIFFNKAVLWQFIMLIYNANQ